MTDETDGFVKDNPGFDNPGYDPADDDDAPRPEPKPPIQQKAPHPIPAYLQLLMSMPGMNALDLAVDLSTAWVVVNSNGLVLNTPLAFLAPEALATLEAKGHGGHTTFQFSKNQGADLIAYMACELRVPEGGSENEAEWGSDVSPEIQNALIAQEQKISVLTVQLNRMLEDPLKPLETAFTIMDRMGEYTDKMMSRLPKGAGGGLDVSKIVDTIATVTEVVKGAVGGVPGGDPNQPINGDIPDGE